MQAANPTVPTTQLSAVGIHIYNPQAINNAPGPVAMESNTQQKPQEQQIDKSIYNVPQNSVYGNQPGTANAYASYAAPMVNKAPTKVSVPPPQIDNAPVATPAAEVKAAPAAEVPAPVVAPAPVVVPTPAPEVKAPPVAETPAPVATPAPAPEVKAPPVAETPAVKPAANPAAEIVAGLTGPVAKQTEQIQKLADLAQNKPAELTALLTSSGPEVLQGLVSVFNQKAEGADAAPVNENKKIAIFTTALMAKNFRDAMNVQIQKVNQDQKQNIPAVSITDLPGINEIINKIRPEAEPNVEVRSAAIQALSFLTQPEDSAMVGEVLGAIIGDEKDPAKKGDPDASVKEVAKQALAALPPAPVVAPKTEVKAEAAPAAEAPKAEVKAEAPPVAEAKAA